MLHSCALATIFSLLLVLENRACQFSNGSEDMGQTDIYKMTRSTSELQINYGLETIQTNLQKALAVVKKNGYDLKILSPELRDNRQVVLNAVSDVGLSIKYASCRLKNEKEIALAAINNSPKSLYFLTTR